MCWPASWSSVLSSLASYSTKRNQAAAGGLTPLPAAAPFLMTAADLIKRSLQDLGYLGAGESVPPDELADFYEALKDLVDGLPTRRLGMHEMLRSVHPLATGKNVYTIGPGGDIDIARPEFIDSARLVQDTGDPAEDQLELDVAVLNNSEWASVAQKQLRSSYVSGVWYDYAFSNSGRGNLHVYPVPDGSDTALVLYTPQVAVTQFANVGTTDYVWAPGAARMLRKKLAVELAPMARTLVTQELLKQAQDSEDDFYERGLRPSELRMPAAGITGGGVAGVSQSSFDRGPF